MDCCKSSCLLIIDRSLLRLPLLVLWAQLRCVVAKRANHGALCF